MDYQKRPSRNTIRPNKPYNPTHTHVRLIDEEGQMLGIMAWRDAQALAAERSCDLIEIAPDNDPPVCKLGDFGKMRYKEQKKKHELRKKQKIVLLKEIQLRPHIHDHDYQVKLNHAIQFLKDKDRVKINLQFRGREIAFADIGRKLVDRMVQDLSSLAKLESPMKLEGKRLTCVLTPLKTVAEDLDKPEPETIS